MELVRRGLAPSRHQARELVSQGRVTVAGGPALKASRQVRADEPVEVVGDARPFVSRAGEKLAGALEHFALDVNGRRALDAGASTGGFTDCLLQNGAAQVVAVDVGYGQLHEKVRADPRVEALERTNVRDLAAEDLGGPFDLVVADLSFISLRLVVPALLAQAAPGADLVVLVKPQFEAGHVDASKGRGIIRDPAVWRRVLVDVGVAWQGSGAAIMDAMLSPLRGAEGNVEFFYHVSAGSPRPQGPPPDLERLIDDLVSLAVAAGGGAGDDPAVERS